MHHQFFFIYVDYSMYLQGRNDTFKIKSMINLDIFFNSQKVNETIVKINTDITF